MAAEIIGLAASIATLSKITKVAFDIFQLLHDAPASLRQVSEELVIQITSQECLVRELQARLQSSPSAPNDPIGLALNQSLAQALRSLERISASLQEILPRKSSRSMIRWALFGKDNATRLLTDLNSTRASLSTTLVLALCLDLKSARDNTHIIEENRMWQPGKPEVESTDYSSIQQRQCINNNNRDKQYVPRSWFTNICLPFMNQYLAAFLSAVEHERHTTYGISVLLRLPLAYAVTANLIWRTYASSRLSISMLRGSCLNLGKLVDKNCEFFVACERGDVCKMRYMLSNRLAGLKDFTNLGLTPMSMAVKSGKVEAVQLLLDEGVDADAIFGIRQTSLIAKAMWGRHFEVARLLLFHNACCQHITGLGWSPVFYLWPDSPSDPVAEPAGKFLELLSATQDFRLSHLDVFDIAGFGVVHRAAILGQPEDVVRLIKLGVSPYTQQGPLQWNAIQNAVYYNRDDVFEALLPYFENHDIDTPDIRGWTLLHIAASEGHDTITRRLLQLGADWKVRSEAWYSDVAECLYGGQWTPAEVAMGEGGAKDGPRRKNLLISAVKDVIGADAYADDDDGDFDQVWSDAQEYVCVS